MKRRSEVEVEVEVERGGSFLSRRRDQGVVSRRQYTLQTDKTVIVLVTEIETMQRLDRKKSLNEEKRVSNCKEKKEWHHEKSTKPRSTYLIDNGTVRYGIRCRIGWIPGGSGLVVV